MTLQEALELFRAAPKTRDEYLASIGANNSTGRWRTAEGGLLNPETYDSEFQMQSGPEHYIRQAGNGEFMPYEPGATLDDPSWEFYQQQGMPTVRAALQRYDPGFSEDRWLAAGSPGNPFDRPIYQRSPQYDYSRGVPIDPKEAKRSKMALGAVLAIAGGGLAANAAGAGGLASTAAHEAGHFAGLGGLEGSGVLSQLAPEAWGVNPQALADTSLHEVAHLSDFGATAGTPGTGSLARSVASLGSDLGGTDEAAGVLGDEATGGASSGGGVGDFFSNLFTPKNLLQAGGALGSAFLQNSAIDKAVGAQTGAADRATAATLAMYDQNRADLEPWRTAGGAAVKRLSDMLTPGRQVSALELDPGYQFRLDEGTKALERSAAGRGMLYSGPTLKGVQRDAQNFASGEFTTATNRLANLAGLGQTAVNTGVAAGTNAVNQTNQNTIGAGNARASGYIGGANAITGSLSNFLRGMQEEDMLKAIFGARYA